MLSNSDSKGERLSKYSISMESAQLTNHLQLITLSPSSTRKEQTPSQDTAARVTNGLAMKDPTRSPDITLTYKLVFSILYNFLSLFLLIIDNVVT